MTRLNPAMDTLLLLLLLWHLEVAFKSGTNCRSGFIRDAPRGRRSISQTLNLLCRAPQCPAEAGPALAVNGGLASHTNKINPANTQVIKVK
jgi:hypothetical protein